VNLPAALDAEGLVHRYDERAALDGVTFQVASGERFGLLGPNGGGKTTLFRIASTLLAPSAGTMRVLGSDVTREPAAVRRRLGVIFQQPALDAELTVRENLQVQGALVGVTGRAFAQRADQLLVALGLEDRAKSRVKTLSGGLARRADLARGLLHRPDLLLLDEPTTGLDPRARAELWDALDADRRARGTTQVVATHLMEDAERCDRVGILDHGRLVALDTPDALKAALGAEALWLDGPDPDALARLLTETLHLTARPVGRRVLVETESPARLLPAVYDAAGPLVESATLRRPTLEDVFLAVTGRAFGEGDEVRKTATKR